MEAANPVMKTSSEPTWKETSNVEGFVDKTLGTYSQVTGEASSAT